MNKRVRRILITILAFLFFFIFFILLSNDVNGANINFSFDSNHFSEYVFWGKRRSDGWVHQPTLSVIPNEELILLFWGNYGYKEKELNEVDFTLEFTKPITSKINNTINRRTNRSINSRINATVGLFYFPYKTDNSWENTGDIYVGLSANIFLNPSITYHEVFGYDEGNYVEVAISKNFIINPKLTIFSFGKLGYNKEVFREKTGFSHFEFGLKVPVLLSYNFVLMPSVNCVKALADDFEDLFYSGITLHYNF